MNIRKLLDTFDSVGAVVEAAGSKKAANGIRSLKGLFTGNLSRPADEGIDDLRGVLAADTLAARERHLKRLLEAKTDEALFRKAYEDVENDKRIAKDEMDAIAHNYTGGRRSWSSRRAALEAIRKKFVERAYQESKMRIVEKFNVG